MLAVTKTVTFKIGMVMLGVCIYFDSLTVIIRAVLVVLFLLLTTPVSSHLMAREAYLLKMPLRERPFDGQGCSSRKTPKECRK